MDYKIEIVSIEMKDIHLIEKFLLDMGNSRNTFRYFDNRPIAVIKNHVTTVLAVNDKDIPVGYGHLDKEDDRVWLGICVVEKKRGRGIGKLLVEHLLTVAKLQRLDNVYLSVDRANTSAIKLYQTFGFYLYQIKDNVYIFHRPIWEIA